MEGMIDLWVCMVLQSWQDIDSRAPMIAPMIGQSVNGKDLKGNSCCLVMLATIRSRTFCLLVCCEKNIKIRIYKTIILPVVLYGCETWSLILRKEHRPRVFENRVLRRIFGPKRDEVTGE
jgi:hypothetical protein